jgi:hypothetical protein
MFNFSIVHILLFSSRSSKGFWHPLDCVSIPTYVHARHTGNLANAPSQFLIARGDNKAPPLFGHSNQTVVGIASPALTRNSLKPRIFGQTQGKFVFSTQFFQFAHDTIRNTGDALCQQTVHHGSDHVQFLANRKVDKVGIHQDMIRRAQLSIVLEKESRDCLFYLTRFFFLSSGHLLLLSLDRVGLYSSIFWANDSLGNRKLASLFGLPHLVLQQLVDSFSGREVNKLSDTTTEHTVRAQGDVDTREERDRWVVRGGEMGFGTWNVE